jgi:hypothetical protein
MFQTCLEQDLPRRSSILSPAGNAVSYYEKPLLVARVGACGPRPVGAVPALRTELSDDRTNAEDVAVPVDGDQ